MINTLTIAQLINSPSSDGCEVYMIPHTKLRYFDEVHKIWDSQPFFFFSDWVFMRRVIKRAGRRYDQAAPFHFICFSFSRGQNLFSYPSEICLVHEKKEKVKLAIPSEDYDEARTRQVSARNSKNELRKFLTNSKLQLVLANPAWV